MISKSRQIILLEKQRLAELYNLTVDHITKLKNDYCSQRSSCNSKLDKNKNKVEMRLTFIEWLDIWVKSGKIHQRGKKIGEYCMARRNDIGHYEHGNVDIILSSENSRMAPNPEKTPEFREMMRQKFIGIPRPPEVIKKIKETWELKKLAKLRSGIDKKVPQNHKPKKSNKSKPKVTKFTLKIKPSTPPKAKKQKPIIPVKIPNGYFISFNRALQFLTENGIQGNFRNRLRFRFKKFPTEFYVVSFEEFLEHEKDEKTYDFSWTKIKKGKMKESTKQKLREIRLGMKFPNRSTAGFEARKKIIIIDGMRFKGMKAAAAHFGVHVRTIPNWLNSGKAVYEKT